VLYNPSKHQAVLLLRAPLPMTRGLRFVPPITAASLPVVSLAEPVASGPRCGCLLFENDAG